MQAYCLYCSTDLFVNMFEGNKNVVRSFLYYNKIRGLSADSFEQNNLFCIQSCYVPYQNWYEKNLSVRQEKHNFCNDKNPLNRMMSLKIRAFRRVAQTIFYDHNTIGFTSLLEMDRRDGQAKIIRYIIIKTECQWLKVGNLLGPQEPKDSFKDLFIYNFAPFKLYFETFHS